MGTGGAGGSAGCGWQEQGSAVLQEPCRVVLGRAAFQAGEQGSVIPGQGRPGFSSAWLHKAWPLLVQSSVASSPCKFFSHS